MNRLFILLALVIITKAGAQNPALAVGDSLMETGQYSKAIKAYEKAPISQAYIKLAKAYRAIGDNGKALKFYQKAYDKSQSLSQGYAYGSLLRQEGRLAAADTIFTALIKAQPENASVYYQLGMIREAQKDSTALSLFEKAVELNPEHANARYQLARFLLSKKQYKRVDTLLIEGLSKTPNNTKLLTLSALKHYLSREYPLVIEKVQKLDSLRPINVQMREYLASSFARTYQYENALEQFKILINEYDDQNANWHYTLAKCYMGMNEIEKARRHVNIAIGLLDVPLDAHLVTLAITYNREGNYKLVMETLVEALEENPNNETARFQLAVAADNRYDDKAKVLPYYEAYVNQFPEGRNIETVQYRISDLKKELFMGKD